ncbi:uncharacterized protein LOC129945760 isoform X2 [Eupeodes corollae]|uniref:uncharacterized protein LOC129945760 isoform X2 n=1 Tax=Eupeodes corollae TaxID=290404 RepID=UPI002491164E|nr:uncharacterized protein LOC129945760 isoform X2 [Eupeodes corollae]
MAENKDKQSDKDKEKEKGQEQEKVKDKSIEKQRNQAPSCTKDATSGAQRVYKKTSPNSTITLYLPTREIVLSGSNPTILRGIVFVDPQTVKGFRIYTQLTLTFRYGREDEEVMGLRFCNEAIMSLHQVWPRSEDLSRESLSPLQDALIKRLGEGAHPFTLNLSPKAPPSVQLVPAKRYYGAPIGTSYDIRCFIGDTTGEKFHRRASVRMGVRVIHRTDVHCISASENYAALINSQISPPILKDHLLSPLTPQSDSNYTQQQLLKQTAPSETSHSKTTNWESQFSPPSHFSVTKTTSSSAMTGCNTKPRKSEQGDSFAKLRLSPKSFRFSGRFGRSKSEIDKCPNDSFFNYSKSFQEYERGGPQAAVDKPFLLQEGRVSLRASLDKAWYTHGENVIVNVNIHNDSRKTVRKIRVCAIQHVDVCMFNNGKFKNIVADSDNNSNHDRTVNPGATLSATFILRPQRGPTKNWIALEDTLQRSTEPEEITGEIAASAIRSPTLVPLPGIIASNPEDRNVFAIYVSYYVKVKLTLSGIGGELSLKLPFVLVHVEDYHQNPVIENQKLVTHEVHQEVVPSLERIGLIEDELNISIPEILSETPNLFNSKRKLLRSETIAKDLSDDDDDGTEKDEDTQVAAEKLDCNNDIVILTDAVHRVDLPDEDNSTIDKEKEGQKPSHRQIVYGQVHSDVSF